MGLTLIPFHAHWLLNAWVSCATTPLEAAYAGTLIPPWNVRREAILMIRPRLPWLGSGLERRYAPKSRHNVNTVVMLTWTTLFQSSSGNSSGAWRFWMPAQVRRISIL